jgi:hypothetical protein
MHIGQTVHDSDSVARGSHRDYSNVDRWSLPRKALAVVSSAWALAIAGSGGATGVEIVAPLTTLCKYKGTVGKDYPAPSTHGVLTKRS